jgi:hypothetical protein
MRTFRALMIAATVVAAIPTIAVAQGGRQFKDSWFWGVKGGGFTVADSSGGYTQAPTIGIDWLITRKRGGLYISGAQSFFTSQSFTLRDPATIDSGLRAINLKNMRHLDVAVMGFPMVRRYVNPYIGAGFSLQQIAQAIPVGPFSNADQLNYATLVIDEQKVSFSPYFIGGVQWRLRPVSVFVQVTSSPAQRQFIAYNGKPLFFGYELGLRYNIGTSIDKEEDLFKTP